MGASLSQDSVTQETSHVCYPCGLSPAALLLAHSFLGLHEPGCGIVSASDLNSSYRRAGMQDAVDLLHPLLTDTVDYVKQGALIATALVLMQQPESKVHCNLSVSLVMCTSQ